MTAFAPSSIPPLLRITSSGSQGGLSLSKAPGLACHLKTSSTGALIRDRLVNMHFFIKLFQASKYQIYPAYILKICFSKYQTFKNVSKLILIQSCLTGHKKTSSHGMIIIINIYSCESANIFQTFILEINLSVLIKIDGMLIAFNISFA
jgi:hypothetical protein